MPHAGAGEGEGVLSHMVEDKEITPPSTTPSVVARDRLTRMDTELNQSVVVKNRHIRMDKERKQAVRQPMAL